VLSAVVISIAEDLPQSSTIALLRFISDCCMLILLWLRPLRLIQPGSARLTSRPEAARQTVARMNTSGASFGQALAHHLVDPRNRLAAGGCERVSV
jgi:hypothetical protein